MQDELTLEKPVDTVVDFTPEFDPLVPHPGHVRDPYVVYRALRENAPVYRSPYAVWIASRHREVSLLLKDARFGRGYFYFENLEKRMGTATVNQPIYKSARNMMLMKDGAEHTRVKELLAKAYSVRRVTEMRPRIQSIMDGLIAEARQQPQLDIMRDLAFPLPSAVICAMVGIPESDWGKFRKRSATGSRALEPAPLSPLEMFEQNQSVEEFHEYFSWLIDLRTREPGEDLTTALIGAEIDGHKLSRVEMIDNIRMLFIGGQETTVNTIGNGLLALFQNPDQLELLRADPSLLPAAVVEMIRYDSSVQMTPRQAREDVRLGDVDIAAGETVICLIASANRDPEAYEDADRFDIRRKKNYPLSFGGGPHFCLGAQLGKIEAEVAIASILGNFPNLKPQLDDLQWLPNTVVFRGLKSLPAAY
jgi:cytochrome P450